MQNSSAFLHVKRFIDRSVGAYFSGPPCMVYDLDLQNALKRHGDSRNAYANKVTYHNAYSFTLDRARNAFFCIFVCNYIGLNLKAVGVKLPVHFVRAYTNRLNDAVMCMGWNGQ